MALYIPNPRWEAPELLRPGQKIAGPVEIDWSHPMTKGLVSFPYIGPVGVYDLVTGNIGYTEEQGNFSFNPVRGQFAMQCASAAVSYNLTNIILSDTPGFTLAVRSLINQTTATNMPIALNKIGENTQYTTVYFDDEPEFRARSSTPTGSSIGFMRGGPYIADKWYNMAARFVVGTCKIFVDGRQDASTSESAFTPHDCERITLGSRHGASWQNTLNGAVSFGALWLRGLSDAELGSFTRHPTQFLIPK